MRDKIGEKQRLLHILDAIRNIESYIGGIRTEIFFDKSGCIFQLEIIGEAANHLSDELKEKYTGIAWHEIVAVRNIIPHFYWASIILKFGIL